MMKKMKYLLIALFLLFGISMFVSATPVIDTTIVNTQYVADSLGSIVNTAGQIISQKPETGGSILSWVSWVLIILVFIYEIAGRVIVTLKDYTIFNNIGRLLDWIAKAINGLGNVTKLPDGTLAVFKNKAVKVPKIIVTSKAAAVTVVASTSANVKSTDPTDSPAKTPKTTPKKGK